MIPQILIDEDLKRWLLEDIPLWDITTSLLLNYKAKGKIFAKQEGIIAGLFLVKRAFEMVGAEIKLLVEEGSKVANKTPIVSFTGDINSLLQIERLALNILGRLSGIATQTDLMINITKKYNPNIRICATRKTAPGLAKYDKYAITKGGGDTHRFNLSDMILLKENHLKMFKSITEAIEKAKNKTSFSKKIEVEVKNKEEALEAVTAGADIIMLDNFKPVNVKLVIPAIKNVNPSVLIELSGNINSENVELYAVEGVDLISSGALTHTVKNFDLTMLIE